MEEPWRHTDLKGLLYREPVVTAPMGLPTSAVRDLLEGDRLGVSRIVFLDGVFSEELSHQVRCGDHTFIGGVRPLHARSKAMLRRVIELLAPLPEVDMYDAAVKDSLGCAKL